MSKEINVTCPWCKKQTISAYNCLCENCTKTTPLWVVIYLHELETELAALKQRLEGAPVVSVRNNLKQIATFSHTNEFLEQVVIASSLQPGETREFYLVPKMETEPVYDPCLHCSETKTEVDDEGYKYCIHCGHRRMGQKPDQKGGA